MAIVSITLLIHLASLPTSSYSPAIRIVVPIETNSPGLWNTVIGSAPAVGMVVINPSNGPIDNQNASWARFAGEAESKGIVVLGYVSTDWASGQVSVLEAEKLIDSYYTWYRVDGIFLDEANNSCNAIGFYEQLYNYVKEEPGKDIVVLNPGTSTSQCYASVSDILLTFEDSYQHYQQNYVGMNWSANYTSDKFCQVIYGVPTVNDMKNVISTAIARGAGWIYVTNMENDRGDPYSRLPSYFTAEVRSVSVIDGYSVPATNPWYTSDMILSIVGVAAIVGLASVFLRRERLKQGTSSQS